MPSIERNHTKIDDLKMPLSIEDAWDQIMWQVRKTWPDNEKDLITYAKKRMFFAQSKRQKRENKST